MVGQALCTRTRQPVPGTGLGGWFASIQKRFAKVHGTNGTPGTIGYWLPTAGHIRWEPTNASRWAISRSPPASLLRLGFSILAFPAVQDEENPSQARATSTGTIDPADLAIGSRTNARSQVKMRFGRSPRRHALSLSVNRNDPSRWCFSVLSAIKDLLLVMVPFVPSTGLAGCN